MLIYIKVCDPDTLLEIEEIKDKALVVIAVRFGNGRLMDNFTITP